MSEIFGLTSTTGQLVNSIPVSVLDFWAPWCQPCMKLGPILSDLADELAGKVVFLKVNTDDEPELAEKYGVQSVPTLVRLELGELKSVLTGAQSKRAILKWLDIK